MRGKALETVRSLDSGELPDSTCARMAIACACAISGRLEEAQNIIAQTPDAEADETSASLLHACLAYVALEHRDFQEFETQLNLSLARDGDNPLPWYSLGLHSLWRRRDYEAAQTYLARARLLAPDSGLAKLGHLSLEAEQGNLLQANELISDKDLRENVSAMKLLAVRGVLLLARTPFGGGLVALLLAPSLFIPFIGLPLLSALLCLSLVIFLAAKNISPRLAVVPAIYSSAWVAIFFVRTILVGKVFP